MRACRRFNDSALVEVGTANPGAGSAVESAVRSAVGEEHSSRRPLQSETAPPRSWGSATPGELSIWTVSLWHVAQIEVTPAGIVFPFRPDHARAIAETAFSRMRSKNPSSTSPEAGSPWAGRRPRRARRRPLIEAWGRSGTG